LRDKELFVRREAMLKSKRWLMILLSQLNETPPENLRATIREVIETLSEKNPKLRVCR